MAHSVGNTPLCCPLLPTHTSPPAVATLSTHHTAPQVKITGPECVVQGENAFFPLPAMSGAGPPDGRGWPAKPLSADLLDQGRGAAAAPPPQNAASVAALQPGAGLKELFTENAELSEMLTSLAQRQLEDPVLKIVHQWVADKIVPTRNETMGTSLMTYARILDQLHIDAGGRLWRQSEDCFFNTHQQFLMPVSMFEPLWRVCHQARASPHPGVERTLKIFKQYVYAPDLLQLIEMRSRGCNDCMLRISKTDLQQGYHSRDTAGVPNGCWSIDTVGPISQDGDNIYILSCQDLYSRFLQLEPMPNKRATTVVRTLFKMIKTVGLPARIRTDLGLEFKNQLLTKVCREFGIGLTNSIAYFHNSNVVERAHRELNNGLKLLLPSPPDGWVNALAPLLIAYNSQEHRTTGFSPNRLFFGRESFHPLQLNLQVNLPQPATAAEHLLKLKKQSDIVANRLYHANGRYLKQMAHVYNNHPDKFEVGDSVYIVNKYYKPKGVSERLIYRWAGPATVLEVKGNYLVLKFLNDKLREQIIEMHVSLCRKRVRGDRPLAPSPETMEPEEYTTLLLPPFPSSSTDTWPTPRVPLEVKEEDDDDPQGPAGDDPGPAEGGGRGPAVPPDVRPAYVMRSGRISRPPVRYLPADFATLCSSPNL